MGSDCLYHADALTRFEAPLVKNLPEHPQRLVKPKNNPKTKKTCRPSVWSWG